MASSIGIAPSMLDVDYTKNASDSLVGPYWNILNVTVKAGELIGYKQDPWEWFPAWGYRHSLMLHVLLTKNEQTNNTEPVSASMPELTEYYLNLVIQGLVIERGVTIGIETEEANWCTDPWRVINYINTGIRQQIQIIQAPDRPRHFDVTRK
jgi:hypothetical protein